MANKEKLPNKKYYTVSMEVLAPVVFTYKILAVDPEEALKLADRATPIERKFIPSNSGFRKITAKVYLFGTTLIQLLKRF